MFVVSTPIGNLGDLTYRAADVLRTSAALLAEDTRHTRRLLEHYAVTTPMLSYHEHNEARMVPRVIARLEAGEDLALVTDAGTPLISDPGARLVSAAIEHGIPVIPIPGPSALLAALVASGVATDRFTFFGFLARRGKERELGLRTIVATPHTVILYEAPGRVAATLADLADRGAAERAAVVARELTKRYEEIARGTVRELAKRYAGAAPKGEVVIVLAPVEVSPELDEAELSRIAARLQADGISPRDVARRLVDEHGAPRNLAYRLAHERATE